MTALEILKHYQEYKVEINQDTYCKPVGVKKEYYIKAIAELEDLKSRSCNNCKYYEETIRKNVIICTKLNTNYGKDFYCNKYEAKEKK